MPSLARAFAEPLETRRLWASIFPLTLGGGGFDNVQKTVQNRTGDFIVTGEFSGTTNFAPKGQKVAVLSARGDTDVFVADYSAAGVLKWAIQIGGDYHSKQMSDYTKRDIQISQGRFTRFEGRIGGQPRLAGEYANDIAVDDAGNIYLAGAFRSSITAGRFHLSADQTFTSSYYDALVVKISAGGSVTWARQFGGAFDDDAMTIGLDAKGNPTIGGYYTRQTDFDPSGKTDLLRTDGRDAGFVLRLTTDGALAWVYQFDSEATGTDERDAVNDLVVTRAGEVYFDGTYADKADFIPGDGEYTLKSEGKTDAFVAKLNRKGGFAWAKSTGGNDYDGNSAITMDAAGNIYTAGYFTDDADVNPDPNAETIYRSTPEDGKNRPEFSDLLVTKFTPDGNMVWTDQIGGQYIELTADITVDAGGDVYLAGSFFGTMDTDPGRTVHDLVSTPVNTKSIKDNNTTFGRDDSYDWFVTKLSPRGKFVAAANFGQADDDYAAGITALSNGDLLLSGRIVSSGPADRDNRQEQGVIDLLGPNLDIL